MSGASRVSKNSKAANNNHGQVNDKNFDAMSYTSSQVAHTEVYSEIAEEDEWTAIQKFNTLLHYEE